MSDDEILERYGVRKLLADKLTLEAEVERLAQLAHAERDAAALVAKRYDTECDRRCAEARREALMEVLTMLEMRASVSLDPERLVSAAKFVRGLLDDTTP